MLLLEFILKRHHALIQPHRHVFVLFDFWKGPSRLLHIYDLSNCPFRLNTTIALMWPKPCKQPTASLRSTRWNVGLSDAVTVQNSAVSTASITCLNGSWQGHNKLLLLQSLPHRVYRQVMEPTREWKTTVLWNIKHLLWIQIKCISTLYVQGSHNEWHESSKINDTDKTFLCDFEYWIM